MSAQGGNKAIFAALGANLGIAATKFVAYALTGAGAMLAEGIHSVADSGNQVLLLVGGRRADRDATEVHPFGYGRQRYVYAFVVSIVLFVVGGLFALYEGVHKWLHPEPLEGTWRLLPLVILTVSVVMEGLSFRTAMSEAKADKAGHTWRQYVLNAKAPELPVVLMEDFAALIGLILALIAVGGTLLTGDGHWDAVGTILIGVLLIGVAWVLAVKMNSLLIGEAAHPAQIAAIEEALVGGSVQRVIHMKTLHLGPDELLVAAKIAVEPTESAQVVAGAIDEAEARVRAVVPLVLVMYLEPDIDREQ
jgi:cation diffusion facilitator family transporter